MAATWTPEQLAAATTVLIGCIAANAVVLARTYARVANIVEGLHRSGIPVRGVHRPVPATALNRATKVGGAGAAPGTVPLLPTDPINQLMGVTVTAAPAPTGPVDCGPACVVSVIEELKGCWSADELLRLRYFGAVDQRLTTAADLVGMLQANGITAHHRDDIDAATARSEITRNASVGRPSLILGTWVTPGYQHWAKFLGDRGGPVVMDPWGGIQRRWSWEFFAANFAGEYVHVDSLAETP